MQGATRCNLGGNGDRLRPGGDGAAAGNAASPVQDGRVLGALDIHLPPTDKFLRVAIQGAARRDVVRDGDGLAPGLNRAASRNPNRTVERRAIFNRLNARHPSPNLLLGFSVARVACWNIFHLGDCSSQAGDTATPSFLASRLEVANVCHLSLPKLNGPLRSAMEGSVLSESLGNLDGALEARNRPLLGEQPRAREFSKVSAVRF